MQLPEITTIAGPYPSTDPTWPSIEYMVQVSVNSKPILTTPFRLGLGHVKLIATPRLNLTPDECRMFDTWVRKPHADFVDKQLQLQIAVKLAKGQSIKPQPQDVLNCLLLDADVLNYASFEDWADSFGYDPDSIKALNTYNQCLKTALVLNAHCDLQALRELQQ